MRGNVLGMMPHPENHVEAIMGCTDGRGLFAGLVAHHGGEEPRSGVTGRRFASPGEP